MTMPEEWAKIAREEPLRWAKYLGEMDQTYSAAKSALDAWIDVLVSDFNDRPEDRRYDDAQPMMALTVSVWNEIKERGGISFQMLAIYNTAVYRLARQKFSAAIAS